MIWTAADVYLVAPELLVVPIPVVNKFITFASAQFSPTAFGVGAQYAGILLTAHLLTVSNASGSAAPGPISSVTVGQVSTSYDVSSTSSAVAAARGFDGSTYGREYARMARGIFGAMVV
jgi:hypothetical protein